MEIPKGYDLRPPEGWEDKPIDPTLKAIMDGKSKIVIPGSNNPVLRAFTSGEKRIDLSKKHPHLLVSMWALTGPTREYVIKRVKLPLQKAIENAKTLSDMSKELMSAVRKIPKIDKENVSFLNSHVLIDKRELFLKYHTQPCRQKMMEAAFNMLIFEYEHDSYYAFILDWLFFELAMELAKGHWIPRFRKFPIKGCWAGPDLPDVETIRENLREALKE